MRGSGEGFPLRVVNSGKTHAWIFYDHQAGGPWNRGSGLFNYLEAPGPVERGVSTFLSITNIRGFSGMPSTYGALMNVFV